MIVIDDVVRRAPVTLLGNVFCWFGEWVHGRNAGGSISYPTLHTNPQFAFHITAGLH